jgi:uncharacterized membrane protein required for colicin V production
VNLVDLAIVLILVFFMYSSYNQGFLYSLFRLFSGIFALIITNYTYPYVNQLIKENTDLYDTIQAYIHSSILKGAVIDDSAHVDNLINKLNIPDFLVNIILKNNDAFKRLNLSSLTEHIVSSLSDMALSIISMMAVYLIVSFILRFISRSLRFIRRIPIIGLGDRIMGLGLGFLQGVLVVWLALTVVGLLSYNSAASLLIREIDDSLLASKFQNMNIILNFIIK